MAAVCERETLRQLEQQRLDGLKPAAERNRWGQFATPPALALEIAQYALGLLEGRPLRFLEPAVGSGAFYSALLASSETAAIESAVGIELDPLFAQTARTLWEPTGLQVIEGDFTALAPLGRSNLIITNPPYVRHHHLDAATKERLRGCVLTDLRLNISGLAGLYCYFMLLADKWLDDDGLSIWLVPTEFMTVNYGQAVKDYLLRRVSLLHVHRFCPSDVQFADALVSSAIVIFRKAPPPPDHQVRFSFGGRLQNPQHQQLASLSELERERKWTRFAEPGNNGDTSEKNRSVMLGDLFSIKRGIATGDNRFFVLKRAEADRLGIPPQFCKPILPSPRNLRETVIEADSDGYPLIDPQLCVIDCNVPEEAIQAEFPRFWEYLQSGKREGIDRKYLTSRRIPWYSQEKRDPAPFFCTYMGRASRSQGRNPFRFFWNKSEAIAANVYLLLYPRGALRHLLRQSPHLYGNVFEALSQISLESCLGESRVYGGGLYKLEPRELANISAKSLTAALGQGLADFQGLLFV